MPGSGGRGRSGRGGGKQISVWEEKLVPLAGRSNLKLEQERQWQAVADWGGWMVRGVGG